MGVFATKKLHLSAWRQELGYSALHGAILRAQSGVLPVFDMGVCQRQTPPVRGALLRLKPSRRYSKVWFNTPELCSGSNNAIFTKIWY
jgi:hypothetical protein